MGGRPMTLAWTTWLTQPAKGHLLNRPDVIGQPRSVRLHSQDTRTASYGL